MLLPTDYLTMNLRSHLLDDYGNADLRVYTETLKQS